VIGRARRPGPAAPACSAARLDNPRADVAYIVARPLPRFTSPNMAKNQDLPGFYEKRKILFSERTSPEKMRRTGQMFMEAGRYDDALEFFQRCEAEDLVRRIAAEAMEDGNTPLYMRAKKVLGEQVSESEWTGLAAAAERAATPTMAHLAHRQAGHEEEAARLRAAAPRLEEEEEPDAEDHSEDAQGQPGPD